MPSRGLAAQEESLRVLSLAADLERPKVSEPKSLRRLGVRLTPELELVEIFHSDLSVPQPIEEVIAERRRQICPLNPGH